MKISILIVCVIFLIGLPKAGISADILSCTIEKSFSSGLVLENPTLSTSVVKIEAKPFGNNHIFSLSPADAECEIRIPNPEGGSFLNCWTLDKKHGFRSDRTLIDNQSGIKNTLTYADGSKQLTVRVTVWCK
jgi:hypothetical protein